MKSIYLLAASALALTVAACGPKTPVARASLECPAKQGELTRTSTSADGKVCTYSAAGGAEVTLQLVSLQGGVDSTLSTIENNLLAMRVQAKASDAKGAKPASGEAKSAPAAAPAEAKSDVGRAVNEALADAKASGVDVKVARHGHTTVITEDGGTTQVNLPGIHIVANDDDDSANVKIGPLSVNAGNGGAIVRLRRDVRLRGESLNPKKRGLRATFIYTGDDLPDGYRLVGYEAGGPKNGPLAVAVVKAKTETHDGEELYPDVKRLVRRNGGV